MSDVLEGVYSDKVSKPSQASLGAVADEFSAELMGPALVRWEDII